MKKITYEMELLSSLIISPRAGQALYKGLDTFCSNPVLDKSLEGVANVNTDNKIKVVYPFYQYGEYTKYDPEHAEYYIPGSSVKGALLQNENEKGKGIRKGIALMADDIPVDRKSIVLRNLMKVQYAEQKDKAEFKPFFENVGIEMMRAGTELCGKLYLDDELEFAELIKTANEKSGRKMRQMCKYLQGLLNSENNEFTKLIHNVEKSLFSLSKEKDVILIGGYKGLLHSIILSTGQKSDEIRSGIYIDLEKNLPHGLVRIKCKPH